ncbi:Receptor-type tyrosine-protein phosphatase eta [Larimichthys crocea]|uniref:Receptor-type tyrosine-protein phosphatase eta n=1 Tax=Larimichthys crocea TaxID=215358 RepID=A0A6G0IZ31_LARCR|nr:Receptor-type tyrosine-protein phosphatase eta [Larimichthys crocea]
MKPLLRFSVSLWALLVFSAVLKICDSRYTECNGTTTTNTTTTTVTLTSTPNCNLSISGITYDNSLATQLTPGKVYEIVFVCLNCTKNVTMRPEVVRNLTVTEITTSSLSLSWIQPEGYSSFYIVKWSNGTFIDNVTGTQKTISNLTPGVHYNISVTAVAADGLTDGQISSVSQYTRPEVVRNLTVTEITTSSLSLSWIQPEGYSSFYIVKWSNGTFIDNVTGTQKTISNLTPGVHYNISVTAVAADGLTYGQIASVTHYTRPEVVRNLTVTEITTSSLSLSWIQPEGYSSFYIVKWSNGTFIDNDLGNIDSHSVYTNTSSIFLNWTRPSGEVFKYLVEWNNGGVLMHIYTNDTATVLSDLIPGTKYNITIFAVNGDDTTGDPYTFSSVTKPDVVNSLNITSITTTSVSLAWTEPVGNATSYRVQWTPGEGEAFTNATSFTISHLIPGYQYNISVAAVAETSTGKESSKTTFTSPDQPKDIISTAPGTRDLNISWTLPTGRVDSYVVNISNADLDYSYSQTTTVNMANFTSLNPGRVYDITVTAVAGSFYNTSVQTSHATRPIPPASIIISQRTNSSLSLNWPIPHLMAGAPNITYYITYQVEGDEVQSIVNNTLLSSLSSGTRYNISLVTGGPQNLKSTAVYNSTFTQPNPVLNLIASPKSTTSVELKWSYPHEVKSYYKYRIHVFNTTATFDSTEIDSTNETVIGNLEPGTRYSIKVTTIVSEGIESTEEETSSYTMPKAVTNLIAEFVNTTAIKLTWLRQSDHKPSYSYEVIARLGAMMVKNGSTENETYTFSMLSPGTLYTFKVFTVVEEVKSTVESTENYTKPEAVSNITVIGSTTNLSVHWRPPPGEVAFYTVLVYRDSQLVKNSTDLSNNTENKLFLGLMPAVRYCVMVVTKSGPLETNSLLVCNATFPNPPGAIMVDSQTVDAINFTWPLPEGMDHNQYNFSVSTINDSFLTENNWFLLDNLQSGTPYNITVVTVSLQNYESTAVTTETYTRPYPVTKLKETKITTDAVTLVWEQPERKPHYSYLVQTSNSSISKNVSVTMSNITGLNSGTNYSFTVITRTADGTQSAPVTVSYFTRPYGIRQLVAETLNTTAVRLVWVKPLQDKAEYTYRVETTGFDFQNITIEEDNATISELTPGANNSFCVLVMAANGIEGEPVCISRYTEPETVQPSVSSQGSNSSILVSWTKPRGVVEYYMVHLNDTVPKRVSSNNTSWLFEDLSAGRLYTAIVTTFSGPFNASSEFVTNATFPNPPGPIEILMKTVSSIEIRWKEAPLMTNASFKYLLSNISSQGVKYIASTTATHNFTSLRSGTSYNISVATVGAMDFQSKKVKFYSVTTRPFSANKTSVL